MGAANVTDELATRIDEVALPVEIVVAEILLDSDAIDRANEIAVRQGVRHLLDTPQIFGKSARRGRRNQHDLGAVEAERAGALRKMPVVADVDADLAHGRLEDGIAEVPGRK